MPTHHSKMKNNSYGKKSAPNPKIPFKLTTKKLPPNNRSVLLIWEKNWGYDVIESFLVHQHAQDDIKLLGKPRITHWLILEKELKNERETSLKETT